MEYFFLLCNFFNCQRRNILLRQIKILLVILTLTNICCANRRCTMELMQSNATCRKPLKNPHIDKSCRTCGIANERSGSGFVLNGSPVRPHNKYPWMVRLRINGDFNCGGAIISNNFILTAAHCVKKFENQPHSVLIGFVTDTRDVGPIVPVSAIYCHPQYKLEVFGLFDIALIRLKNKITCDKYKSPICLPRENVILPTSTRLTIAGWGHSEGGQHPKLPHELLQGAVQTVKCEKCLLYRQFFMKECRKGMVYCMMGVHNQAATTGDSGSPMFLRRKGKYYVEGVTSFGDPERRANVPFAFASVSTSRSWIKKVAGI